MVDLDLRELPEHDDGFPSEGDGTLRFRAVWQKLGLGDERGPLAAAEVLTSRRKKGFTSIPPPPDMLPQITVGSSNSDAEIALKTEIGDGGMGVIFAASQRSLAREVAVKRLVPEATGEDAIAALVQEARVTGSLEHPNVVPVHALGADSLGRPVMIMRRIHGTPWGTILRARRSSVAPETDALAGHLEILLQVCNAVRFAHSRGIIHGDLKPDNVMLGDFGEVYVLDWGAAMSTTPNDARGLPYAGDVRTVIGTPAYMAPEMIGTGAPISTRTDVYLLGAILHEIVSGAPPHASESLFDSMKTAFVSRPFPYDASVPRELQAICHRAMAHDPEQRFADAQALRSAVAEHLAHRASIALGAEAAARSERLLAAIAQGGEAEQRQIYELYAECRFGFQQALRAWSGNEEARRGLAQAEAAMAELQRATRHELSRLRHIERQHDVEAYARPRRLFVAALATLGAIMLLCAWALDRGAETHGTRLVYAIGLPVGWVAMAGAAAFLGRHKVFITHASRVIVGGVLAAGVAVLVNRMLVMVVRGGTLAEAIAGDLVALAAVAGMIALAADRRYAQTMVSFLVAAVLAVLFPVYAVVVLALALLAFAAGSARAAGSAKGSGPLWS
jgi:serine/threonine-protein kinase